MEGGGRIRKSTLSRQRRKETRPGWDRFLRRGRRKKGRVERREEGRGKGRTGTYFEYCDGRLVRLTSLRFRSDS